MLALGDWATVTVGQTTGSSNDKGRKRIDSMATAPTKIRYWRRLACASHGPVPTLLTHQHPPIRKLQ